MNRKSSKLFAWRNAVISEYGPKRPTTRHLLLTLSLHMHQDGESCFPSTRTLAFETGRSERVVCEHLEYAECEGWIKREICGLSGQGWKRHKYIPAIPEKALTACKHLNDKALTGSQHVGEKGTDISAEGTDIFDKKALTPRQSNSKYNNSKRNSKIYTSDSIEYGLSTLLLDLILQRHSKHKKPNLQKWARYIDLAIRRDKRTEQELRAVIEWSQADSFWQNNILSTEKLRKHFDTLYMQMEGNGDGANRDGKRSGFKKNGGAGSRSKKYSHLGTSLSAEG